jgi:hypothetical protein
MTSKQYRRTYLGQAVTEIFDAGMHATTCVNDRDKIKRRKLLSQVVVSDLPEEEKQQITPRDIIVHTSRTAS